MRGELTAPLYPRLGISGDGDITGDTGKDLHEKGSEGEPGLCARSDCIGWHAIVAVADNGPVGADVRALGMGVFPPNVFSRSAASISGPDEVGLASVYRAIWRAPLIAAASAAPNRALGRHRVADIRRQSEDPHQSDQEDGESARICPGRVPPSSCWSATVARSWNLPGVFPKSIAVLCLFSTTVSCVCRPPVTSCSACGRSPALRYSSRLRRRSR